MNKPSVDLFVVVSVPTVMWQRVVDAIEGDDYCHFCDNHPSHGHHPLCPLHPFNVAAAKERP